MGSAEIVERIKAAMDGMPGQMQTAARFIVDHLSEVALLSMHEQAGASIASVRARLSQ